MQTSRAGDGGVAMGAGKPIRKLWLPSRQERSSARSRGGMSLHQGAQTNIPLSANSYSTSTGSKEQNVKMSRECF